MVQLREVDADLARPSRLQVAREQRVTQEPFKYLDVCDRLLTQAPHGGAASPAVAPVTHQARCDALWRDVPQHHGEVTADDGVSAELLSQAALADDRAGEDDQPLVSLSKRMNDCEQYAASCPCACGPRG